MTPGDIAVIKGMLERNNGPQSDTFAGVLNANEVAALEAVIGEHDNERGKNERHGDEIRLMPSTRRDW